VQAAQQAAAYLEQQQQEEEEEELAPASAPEEHIVLVEEPEVQQLALPQATFVQDVTIPDGTHMTAGTPFTKIWRFRNAGEIVWPASTKLIREDRSSHFDDVSEVVLGHSIVPGEVVDVAIELVAPEEAGRYVSFFRLNVDGYAFGHRVWLDVLVDAPAARVEEPVVAVVEEEDVVVISEELAVPQMTDKEMLLVGMGFELTLVRLALHQASGDVEVAVNSLLGYITILFKKKKSEYIKNNGAC